MYGKEYYCSKCKGFGKKSSKKPGILNQISKFAPRLKATLAQLVEQRIRNA